MENLEEIKKEKLDIRQVLIAPTCKLNINDGYIDINNMYIPDGRYIAIYPKLGTNFKIFYNLYNKFIPINVKSNNYNLGDREVDLDNAKLLVEYLDDYKIAITDRYLSHNKLMYIAAPITQYEMYRKNKNNKKREIKFGRKYINDDIYHKNSVEHNCLLEKNYYFARDFDTSEPVSYGYINDEIPYVLRKKLM